MKNRSKLLITPYVFWICSITILSLGFIFVYGLTSKQGSFTLDNIFAIAEPIHLNALLLSLGLSFLCTTVCLLLSYPLALILSKMQTSQKNFMVFIFILPMWMNSLLRILAMKNILANNGVINTILEALNLPTVNILNTSTAIVLGMVYDYLPFMVLPIYNALIKIDKNIIDAAHDLGAKNSTVLRKIIVPLSMPGVISGIIMVFIPAISEFAISSILGGGKILLFGNVIEQEFTYGQNWNLGSGLSMVLMVFIFSSMFVMNKYDKSGGENALW